MLQPMDLLYIVLKKQDSILEQQPKEGSAGIAVSHCIDRQRIHASSKCCVGTLAAFRLSNSVCWPGQRIPLCGWQTPAAYLLVWLAALLGWSPAWASGRLGKTAARSRPSSGKSSACSSCAILFPCSSCRYVCCPNGCPRETVAIPRCRHKPLLCVVV